MDVLQFWCDVLLLSVDRVQAIMGHARFDRFADLKACQI